MIRVTSVNMLKLGFVLFFCLYKSPVKSQTNHPPMQAVTTEKNTTEEKLSDLELLATPDYPVAAGQTIHLRCSSRTVPKLVTWSWYHLRNHNPHHVANGSELTLTKPKESGVYYCVAESGGQRIVSPNHAVYIIAVGAAVGEKLAIAALFISLLALSITLVAVFWLWQQKLVNTVTVSNTPVKSCPEAGTASKGGMEQDNGDRGVYMNYTTNQSYCNLDPRTVVEDNVYASLS